MRDREVDGATGAAVDVSSGLPLSPTDVAKLEDDEEAARAAQCGTMADGLCTEVAAGGTGELRAAGWIAGFPPPMVKDRTEAEQAIVFTDHRTRLGVVHRKALGDLAARHGVIAAAPDPNVPLVLFQASRTKLESIAFDTAIDVAAIEEVPTGGPLADDLFWWEDVVAHQSHGAGYIGSGIKVSVHEIARPLSASKVCGPGTIRNSSAPSVTDHPQWVGAIVCKGSGTTGGPTAGTAQGASMTFANWDSGVANDEFSALAWALDTIGANVVNISYALGASCAQGAHNKYADYRAKLTPFPTIVYASGNDGAGYCVKNGVFNGLVVGGINYKGTTAYTDDVWATSANYVNYGGTYGDWELPHVSGPSGVFGSCTVANGRVQAGDLEACGTSAAAPAVSGAAAVIMARNTGLKPWPEAIRPMIMVTANSVSGEAAWSPTGADDRVGTGIVDVYRASLLADPLNEFSTGVACASAVGQGYHKKTATFSSDFPGGYYTYDFYARSSWTGKLRAAVAWDATVASCGTPSTCSSPVLDADLDLYVYQCSSCGSCSTLVGSSTSVKNSVEYVQFSSAANTTYRIRVHKYSNTAASTYMGVSWSMDTD